MSSKDAKIGDIVLLKQGIGVVRYYGPVDFDEDTPYYGVELKGPSTPGGHNGTYNGKTYFETTGGDGRGIFIRKPLRIITSEEILEKLAEIYDILKGRKGHSHFIARATYDDLLNEHQQLKEDLQDKQAELEELNMDNSILKEQITMMKGTLGDKIDETAQMNTKIHRAEKKLGSRLSQIDLSSVQHQLEAERMGTNQPKMEIPDYAATTNTNAKKKGHRKQRSSTTIELDNLQDNFGEIARNVQSYGQKDAVSGPMHYRKFSNTTKQILDQHRAGGAMIGQYGDMNGNAEVVQSHRARESMEIRDLVDENGIEYDSDEEQQRLERDSDEENAPKRTVKSRASRESRQLDGDELNNGDYYMNDETEVNERESAEEDDPDEAPKRKVKSRQSRESRQLDDVEVGYGAEDDAPPKRMPKSRRSRDSQQLDEADVEAAHEDDEDEEENEAFDSHAVIDHSAATKKTEQRHKARESYPIPAPVLSAAVLETHNEHHLEKEAGQINGPKDHKTHKKNMSMTSDSSAYRAFMSVD
eukprot:96803_1